MTCRLKIKELFNSRGDVIRHVFLAISEETTVIWPVILFLAPLFKSAMQVASVRLIKNLDQRVIWVRNINF
jgi:hypothetical protein